MTEAMTSNRARCHIVGSSATVPTISMPNQALLNVMSSAWNCCTLSQKTQKIGETSHCALGCQIVLKWGIVNLVRDGRSQDVVQKYRPSLGAFSPSLGAVHLLSIEFFYDTVAESAASVVNS